MTNERVIYKAHKSGTWYTPEPLRELARDVLGHIDLDPCTHPSNPIGARRFFSIRDSARKYHWPSEVRRAVGPERGTASLWMNPPFGRGIVWWLDRWHDTIEALEAERYVVRALLLVPARTETAWYRDAAWKRAQLVCEIAGRTTFERRHRGKFVAGQPARWGVALLYYGPRRVSIGPKAQDVATKLRRVGNVRAAKPWKGQRLVHAYNDRQGSFPFEQQASLRLVKP